MLQQNSTRTQHPLDRAIGKGTGTVSLSAFAFLFSEIVQYHQSRVESISDLERRLEEAGYGVGVKLLELYTLRESAKNAKRETRIIGILQVRSAAARRAKARSAHSEARIAKHMREL